MKAKAMRVVKVKRNPLLDLVRMLQESGCSVTCRYGDFPTIGARKPRRGAAPSYFA